MPPGQDPLTTSYLSFGGNLRQMANSLVATLLVAFATESRAAFHRGSPFETRASDVSGSEFRRSPEGSSLKLGPACRMVEISSTPNCTPPPEVELELAWLSEGERRKGIATLHAWSREYAEDGVIAVFADAIAGQAVVLSAYSWPGVLLLQSELEDVATIPVQIRPPCSSRVEVERLREEVERFVSRSKPGVTLFAADIDSRFGGVRVLLSYGQESLGTWLKAYFGDQVLVHYREPLPAWYKKKRRG